MSGEDVIKRAAEVMGSIADNDKDEELSWFDFAEALHDAGLLAGPKDDDAIEARLEELERDSHPPQPTVAAEEFDRCIHRLSGQIITLGKQVNRDAETWRLRGEFIDALAARSVGHDKKTAEEVREIAADLVAHLDAEGER